MRTWLAAAAVALSCALVAANEPLYQYGDDSPLVELNDANFEKLVLRDDKHLWVVEYYADWCGHCKQFAKGYMKAADNLKGIVKFGALNADTHKKVSQSQGVQGFPSVKLYVPGTGQKNPYTGKYFKPPVDYSGPRTARGVVDFATTKLPSSVVAVTDAALSKFKTNGTLPKALLLTTTEYKAMMTPAGGAEPKWLGSGSLGAIYEVEYAGTRVAVKRFFDSTVSSSAFEREAALLADLRHPNVVQLIKVCHKPQPCIVTELLVCSLHGLLHQTDGGPLRDMLLRRDAVAGIVTHIACGMNYLHCLDPPVLHRNLKSQNLLLDPAGRVKVSDFGWSRLKTMDSGKTFFHGWQWVAPEILAGRRFSEGADVYSFAMVAWEVLTRSLPFHGMNPVQIGLAVRERQLRPPLPDDCPSGFGALLSACWHDSVEKRPPFASVLDSLRQNTAEWA